MDEHVTLDWFRKHGALPHQIDFAVRFLRPRAKPFQSLDAPTGFGKLHIATLLAAYVAQSSNECRILVVLPLMALVEQTKERLLNLAPEVPTLAVSPRSFRELQANVAVDETPWPRRGIVIVPSHLTSDSVLTPYLASVKWDLVIWERAAQQSGEDLINSLSKSGLIVRLLVIGQASSAPDALGDMEAVTWNPQMITGRGTESKLKWSVATFRRGSDEVTFLKALQGALAKRFRDSDEILVTQMLLRRAASSILAIEQTLLRFHSRASDRRRDSLRMFPPTPEVDISDDIVSEDDLHADELEDIAEIADELLPLLSEVHTDEKLAAVLAQLRTIDLRNGVCLLSSFAETVKYLRTAISDAGYKMDSITGATSIRQKESIVENFHANGGLLICTTSSLQGYEFPNTQSVIHYDIPWSDMEFEVRCSRFDRIGRQQRCQMFILRDESNVLWIEEDRLKRLGLIN